ncbi:MAG TPA: type II toxin-antitoxin system RelE/ParE family toxin [archaeon]|nr:type II toxin-antitoxin system RelE/ParE family toxin [archaeon]
MSFELIPSKKVLKELEELEKPLKLRFLDLFIKLKMEPVPTNEFDVIKIGGSDHTYRIRIQKARVIYDVYWKERRIEILKVERRKGRTYKNL